VVGPLQIGEIFGAPNFDSDAAESADVLIDSSVEGATVREGTIVGNTIQAKYSPGGANVRFVGQGPGKSHKTGMFTISDNLIGSQEINVHLVACRGVVVTGNVIYSGHRRNLELTGSRNIVIGPNSFDHNPDYGERELCTGVLLAESTDCTLTGAVLHDCQAGRHTVVDAPVLAREGLLEIVHCKRINVSGCQILDGQPYGVYVADSSQVSITGTSVLETRPERQTLAAVRWVGDGSGNLLVCNTLGRGRDAFLTIDEAAGVRNWENLMHTEGA